MPPFNPPDGRWQADLLARMNDRISALEQQQTQFVVDASNVAQAIIGNLARDPAGNATGLSGFGVGVKVAGGWTPLNSTNAWATYTPTLTGANTSPAIGNGTIAGSYFVVGKLCAVSVSVTFGSSTNGGTGAWTVSLPVQAASTGEQELVCKLYMATSALNFCGVAPVSAGASVASPFFPVSASASNVAGFRSADVSGTAGTGIPQVASVFSVQSGGNFEMQGVYQTA